VEAGEVDCGGEASRSSADHDAVEGFVTHDARAPSDAQGSAGWPK
jgi:hypothetical protein